VGGAVCAALKQIVSDCVAVCKCFFTDYGTGAVGGRFGGVGGV
jgi:hypothetical protein